jgi:aminoglycoside phosphotransferase (APT) family kinase protein
MRERFAAWVDIHAHNRSYFPYARLAEFIRDDTLGLNTGYSFYHGDFHPRNILAQVVDDDIVGVVGIIDWDAAGFAPDFVAFEAPCWLRKMDEYQSGGL